ncbi:MAG: Ig-like domain repeat protein [Betaproteobacteria bacterium]|nr:Ig-like domain repeat protein [Betaproteobacteria bacterium]
MALKSDGTVWAWGYNNEGEIGDGAGGQRNTPYQSAIAGVVSIAAGSYHVRALGSDGTVSAWGYNGYGQLGDGTTASRSWPVVVTGLYGIAALAEGDNFGFVMRNDGAIYALGYNANGALGNGTTTTAANTTPVQVYLGAAQMTLVSSANPAALASSVTFTATVGGTAPTGTVTFRDGATVLATVPVAAGSAAYTTNALTEGVHRIAAEYSGDGTNNPEGSGVLIQTVGAFGLALKVAAGPTANHALAVRADGTLLSWGRNAYGQLGDGTTTNRSKAVRVEGLSGVAAAAAAAERASIALMGDGTVWAWGDLVGAGSAILVPAEVAGLSNVTAVAAGQFHALALKPDGTVWAWGQNANGQLGDGTTTAQAVPVQVSGLSGVVAIAAGLDSSYALKGDGTVWAWGYNGYGNLGNNSTTQALVPVQVTDTAGTGFLTGVSAIAAGRYFAMALKTDGTVWVWAYNTDGQTGDGTSGHRYTPNQSAITGVVAIAAGSYHVRALKSDGTVWAWGWNSDGQLGDGTTSTRFWPVVVTGLSGITAIAEGDSFGFLTRNDGAVYALGYNGEGQLGNGATTAATPPSPTQSYLNTSSVALASSANPAVQGTSVTFTATVTGVSATGWVTFKDGATALATVPLAGGVASLTTNALAIGLHTIAADYSGDTANNPAGDVIVQGIGLGPSLGDALDNLALTFLHGGGTGWFSTTAVSYFGGDAAQSAAITHNESTFLTTTVTGPGTLRFYWKVSSESGYDFLRVFVDGVDQGGAISGNVDWTQRTVPVPAGAHTVVWQYSKDGTVNSGSDAGWVDRVEFILPGTTFTPGLASGFNLMGNSLNTTLDVSTLFGNQDAPVAGVTENVVSIWKWNAIDGRWAFYSPALTAAGIAAYAASLNYEVLATVNPGEGYWVNAINPITLPDQNGTNFVWDGTTFAALISGFNLIATADTLTPSEFNIQVSPAPPAQGVVPTDNFTSLWVWDAGAGTWYFYSPLLEASGGLPAVKSYADSHNFLHFQDTGRTLGIGGGFWVNRP